MIDIRLRSAVLGVLALGVSACSEDAGATNEHGDFAIQRACRYLWSKQAADGGWHSEHYGVMRSGQSMTAQVLLTLLRVPTAVAPRDEKNVRRAVEFLLRHVNDDGALGMAEDVPDYPNYATGLLVSVLRRVGGHPETVARAKRYLLSQQFTAELGWRLEDPAYGAWGMGGAPVRGPGDPGHLDLSMTRVVLQGLASLESPPYPPLRACRVFLDRCANTDGGFLFSTVVLGANKGRRDGEKFASYGSTTADGILSLLASGVAATDPRVVRGMEWLVARHRIDRVPEIPVDSPAQWALGLRFYYMAMSAEVFDRLGVEEAPGGQDWRRNLRRELVATQRAEGSWANRANQVKEDDPLIATAHALHALLAAKND